MSEIKNASFLDVVPVERLSRSHGKRGCHRLIRHDTPSAAGDSARPSNRTGPLTESRRTRQINLSSTLSDLSRPSSLCPTNSVGLGGKESKACKIEARTCHRERRHSFRPHRSLIAAAHMLGCGWPRHTSLPARLLPQFASAVSLRAKQLKPCPGSIACPLPSPQRKKAFRTLKPHQPSNRETERATESSQIRHFHFSSSFEAAPPIPVPSYGSRQLPPPLKPSPQLVLSGLPLLIPDLINHCRKMPATRPGRARPDRAWPTIYAHTCPAELAGPHALLILAWERQIID